MSHDREVDDLLRGLRRAQAGPEDGLDIRLRELGVLYAGVPAPAGAGGDPVLPLLVAEESARHLASPSWVFTGVLLAQTLLATGVDDHLLEEVLAGDARPALCWTGVLGTESSALGVAVADRLVSVRSGADGTATVTVLELADAVRHPLAAVDGSRALLATDATGLPVLASAVLPPAAARSLRAFWLLGIAADCLGTMHAGLALALDQARERHAFGRPIGSFQAVRHRCAELFVDVETTRAAVAEGGAAWAAGAEDGLVAALAAASHAAEASVRVSEAVVLLHGAMGFTREGAPQAHLRRSYGMAALAPRPRTLRIELARG